MTTWRRRLTSPAMSGSARGTGVRRSLEIARESAGCNPRQMCGRYALFRGDACLGTADRGGDLLFRVHVGRDDLSVGRWNLLANSRTNLFVQVDRSPVEDRVDDRCYEPVSPERLGDQVVQHLDLHVEGLAVVEGL